MTCREGAAARARASHLHVPAETDRGVHLARDVHVAGGGGRAVKGTGNVYGCWSDGAGKYVPEYGSSP
jgi:hypothetical protein